MDSPDNFSMDSLDDFSMDPPEDVSDIEFPLSRHNSYRPRLLYSDVDSNIEDESGPESESRSLKSEPQLEPSEHISPDNPSQIAYVGLIAVEQGHISDPLCLDLLASMAWTDTMLDWNTKAWSFLAL